MAAKIYPTNEEIIDKIRNLLKSKGTYSKNLEFSIQLAATNFIAMLHLQRDLERASKTYYTIVDSNGNKVYKIKPEYAKLPDLTTSANKSFAALGLTLDSMSASDEDPLDSLTERLDSLE